MKDTRTDGVKADPRNESETVHVRNYVKSDGTDVSEHERKKPHIKYKLKGRLDEDAITIKGKAELFDSNGRKLASERIDETRKFSGEESGKIKREFSKLP